MNNFSLNAKGIWMARRGVPTTKLDIQQFEEAVAEKKIVAPKSYLWNEFSFGNSLDNEFTVEDKINLAMDMAGLNFTVTQTPLMVCVDGVYQPTKMMANIRTDNNMILGYMTEAYCLMQYDETLLELAKIMMQNTDYETKIVAGGAMAGGAAGFLVLSVSDDELIMGETYEKFIILVNSFNGSTGIMAVICDTRLECLNALTMITKGLGEDRFYNIRHTASSWNKLEDVKNIFRNFKQYQGNLNTYLEDLRKQSLTIAEIEDMFKYILGMNHIEKFNTERKLINIASQYEALVDCYNAPDLSHYGDNKAHVLQAVAQFSSHKMPLRRSQASIESRMARAWKSTPEMERAVLALAG